MSQRVRWAGLVLSLASGVVAGCGAPAHSLEVPTDAPLVPVTFRMTPAPEQGGDPATQVQFVVIWPGAEREVMDVGVFVGACHLVPPRAPSISEVECWWGPRQIHLTARQRGRSIQVQGRRSPEGPEEPLGEMRLRSPARARALGAPIAGGRSD